MNRFTIPEMLGIAMTGIAVIVFVGAIVWFIYRFFVAIFAVLGID